MNQIRPPLSKGNTGKSIRRDIILDLIERGEARGVIEPSDLRRVLSHPLVDSYFRKNETRVIGFIHQLAIHGIEVLENDIDKARYAAVPMVVVVDSPLWSVFNANSIIGEKFYFPNRYRDMVLPGRCFVYFRGASLKASERSSKGYFGCGIVGDVYRDPSSPTQDETHSGLKWIANVRDYRPFEQLVSWKYDGSLLEEIEEHEWADLIRDISADTYLRILDLERSPNVTKGTVMFDGVDPSEVEDLLAFNKFMEECGIGAIEVNPHSVEVLMMPGIEEVAPIAVDSSIPMMIARVNPPASPKDPRPAAANTKTYVRRSKYSAAIGLRAEEIVFRVLQEEAEDRRYQAVRWVSVEGEKPGWDIEIVDALGVTHSIEVKGTAGGIFPSIEITAQEWQSAEILRGRFWLFLVTKCTGVSPKIQRIQDPVSLVQNGTLYLSPLIWKLELTPSDGLESQEPEPDVRLV